MVTINDPFQNIWQRKVDVTNKWPTPKYLIEKGRVYQLFINSKKSWIDIIKKKSKLKLLMNELHSQSSWDTSCKWLTCISWMAGEWTSINENPSVPMPVHGYKWDWDIHLF